MLNLHTILATLYLVLAEGGHFVERFISVFFANAPLTSILRICPGKEFANASAFIAMAMVIASFDISKAKDELGNDVEPQNEYTTASGLRFVVIDQRINELN